MSMASTCPVGPDRMGGRDGDALVPEHASSTCSPGCNRSASTSARPAGPHTCGVTASKSSQVELKITARTLSLVI